MAGIVVKVSVVGGGRWQGGERAQTVSVGSLDALSKHNEWRTAQVLSNSTLSTSHRSRLGKDKNNWDWQETAGGHPNIDY